MVYNTI